MLSQRLIRCTRSLSTSTTLRAASSGGVWSDFTNRPASLKIIDQPSAQDIFNGINPSEGPTSIKARKDKLAYHSPEAIDETFQQAYQILQDESAQLYQLAQQEQNLVQKDSLLIQAERYNPEVIYNTKFHLDKVDASVPVYRSYLKKNWKSKDLMITMQRLETLKMIPDTLPTLDPKVDVKIKFPHNVTHTEFQQWITPGELLPSFAVQQPPSIKIQDYSNKLNEDRLYTVVIVNPDTPDLSTNSFSTTLQYGLTNVKLNITDDTITTSKLLQHEDKWCFAPYQPLVPEKNVGNQRACLWVFKQDGELNVNDLNLNRESFDIRKFTNDFKLTAVGAHIWRQRFDRSVAATRHLHGLPQGRVFHRVRGDSPLN